MPFDKDNANTRRVLGTDNTGIELDGQTRGMVWDVGTTQWVRATASFPSGGTVTVTGAPATVNINGIPTVNIGSTVTALVSGTVTTVGGSGQATVNIAGGLLTATVNFGSIGTVNVGNTVNVLGTATVNGIFWQTTQPVSGSVTATVNLGSIPTVNLGSIGTINVGNTAAVTVTGNVTATVNLGTIPTVNIGSSFPTFNVGNTVNLGTVPTVNVGNTVNLGTAPTFNVGNTLNVAAHAVTVTGNVTATVTQGTVPTFNLGTIPTVNIGSTPTFNVGNTLNVAAHAVTVTGNVTATVNLGAAVPSGPNVVGQVTGRAAVTNPTAVADAATVQYMLDSLGRTIVSRAPTDLNESTTTILTSSANTQVLAGLSGLKHYLGTIGATMIASMAGPTTLRIKNGGPSGAQIWAWTFSGAAPNMTPLDIDPVYANMTASFQVTADLSASNGSLLVLTTGFKGP